MLPLMRRLHLSLLGAGGPIIAKGDVAGAGLVVSVAVVERSVVTGPVLGAAVLEKVVGIVVGGADV